MKKVAVLEELPQNLSLKEAELDLFRDQDSLELDFELEELESRLAFDPWTLPAPCNDNTAVAC